MNNLRDFLNWFSGYAENVKKQPTPSQWARIKEKVRVLEQMADAGPEAAAPAPVAKPTRMTKPSNAREWKAQYQGALIEMGVDSESAREFAATADVDLARDPVAAAKADAGPMLN